jgi:hypothetical protein
MVLSMCHATGASARKGQGQRIAQGLARGHMTPCDHTEGGARPGEGA